MRPVEELMADKGWDIKQAIIHERRVELGLETHRYHDLMRWGKTTSEAILHAHGKTEFKWEKHRYFPYPLTELDKMPNMTQNPEYE